MKRKLIIGGIIAVVAIILGVTIAGGAMGEKRVAKQMDLGNKYLEDGNYEQAILAYEAVIKIDENSIKARTAMAKAYIGLDNMEQAETIAREAIAIDETQSEPWSVLIEVYEQTKTRPELAQVYQEAFDKTGGTQFSDWIQAHTPEKPMANYESGAYEEYLTIELKNQYEDDIEVEYNLNDEIVDVVNELQNGQHELSITVTNDYNLKSTSDYQYSIELADYAIEFVDSEFERMLRMAMNKPKGDIYKSELDYISILEIYGDTHVGINGTQDWRLEACYLSSDNHSIDSYEISGEVYKNNGKITSIEDLKYFDNLWRLTIMCNQINDISVLEKSTNLQMLNLNSNYISDISVLVKLTKLDWLGLSENQISDISALSGLTNLTNLYLDNNKITNLSALSKLENMESLSLYNNQISDISGVSNLMNLTSLNIHHNQISNISALSNLTNLKYLCLEANSISDISALSGLTNLENLQLPNNQISNVSALSGLINLKYLSLWDNPITDYSPLDNLSNIEIDK